MSIYEGTSNVVANYQTAEYGKFIQLTSTDFPAISVTRLRYPDDSAAYNNAGVPPISSVEIYPKYAILAHITNPNDIVANVTVNSPTINFNTAPLTAIEYSIYTSVSGSNATLSNIFAASSAVDINTFDTLTAVTAFNNNFMSSVTALSVTVVNPVTAVSSKQTVTNWDVLSAALNNSTYTTFPSNPANEITVLNNTGGIIYIKNSAKTIGLPIDNNTSFDIKLVGDTNEVAVKASSNNKTVYATFIAYN